MERRIGVRQLKNQATQIVRQVREEGAEFVITVSGDPVAVLRPIGDDAGSAEARGERVRAQMARASALAALIGAEWKSPLSAVGAIREQRREL